MDFSTTSSTQIGAELCRRLKQVRLSKNVSQKQLARAAGVSERTIQSLEKDGGVSLDTFIRVLTGLGLQGNLASLVPDPLVRPVERVQATGRERLRARPTGESDSGAAWTWADENE